METVKFIKEHDYYGHQLLGISVVEHAPHYAKVKLLLEKKHMNAQGITHGGLIFSLADTAAGAAYYMSGDKSVTLSTNINFIGVSREGETIYAEAKLVSATRKFTIYTVTVTNEEGQTLASATCTMYKKAYGGPALPDKQGE